jgi:hypothetical protein
VYVSLTCHFPECEPSPFRSNAIVQKAENDATRSQSPSSRYEHARSLSLIIWAVSIRERGLRKGRELARWRCRSFVARVKEQSAAIATARGAYIEHSSWLTRSLNQIFINSSFLTRRPVFVAFVSSSTAFRGLDKTRNLQLSPDFPSYHHAAQSPRFELCPVDQHAGRSCINHGLPE